MLSETLDERGEKVVGVPSLSPDFLIETYLDHQVGLVVDLVLHLVMTDAG
jgi:hypothetical protein